MRLLFVLVLALGGAALAADEPETVYRRFHDATLARDFDELRKWGTTDVGNELAAMPAWQRNLMIGLIGRMMPKTYSVVGRELSPDGTRTVLRLSTPVTHHGKPAAGAEALARYLR